MYSSRKIIILFSCMLFKYLRDVVTQIVEPWTSCVLYCCLAAGSKRKDITIVKYEDIGSEYIVGMKNVK